MYIKLFLNITEKALKRAFDAMYNNIIELCRLVHRFPHLLFSAMSPEALTAHPQASYKAYFVNLLLLTHVEISQKYLIPTTSRVYLQILLTNS